MIAAIDRGFADLNRVGHAAVPKNSWRLGLRGDGELLIALAGAGVLASSSYSRAEPAFAQRHFMSIYNQCLGVRRCVRITGGVLKACSPSTMHKQRGRVSLS